MRGRGKGGAFVSDWRKWSPEEELPIEGTVIDICQDGELEVARHVVYRGGEFSEYAARHGVWGVYWRPSRESAPAAALKYDDGKAPFELIPWEALESVAQVLAYGATKYAAHNWRNGLGRARLIGAAVRHLSAYLQGVDNDDESGLPHLAHAACCVLFALTFHLQGTHDDRFKGGEQ